MSDGKWDHHVLGDAASVRRRRMIEQRRNDIRKIEWADMVIEWAWFAGAGMFCAGAVFGVIFVRVFTGG